MVTKYNIKNTDGSISFQEPIDGDWYCHFEILEDGRHRDGNFGKFEDDGYGGQFLGEDDEPVDMVSDHFPDYLVKQN